MLADRRAALGPVASPVVAEIDALALRRDFAAEPLELGVPKDEILFGRPLGLHDALGQLDTWHGMLPGSTTVAVKIII